MTYEYWGQQRLEPEYEPEVHPEEDRGSKPLGTALEGHSRGQDGFQLMLELEYRRQQRARLHGHACHVCQRLVTCTLDPCADRGTQGEYRWVCGQCSQEHGRELTAVG